MHSFTLFVWIVIERSLNFMLTTFINCCNIVKFGVCSWYLSWRFKCYWGNYHPNKSCLMKRTNEDYPSFNLFSIVGTWESVNLNPTVIIYRSDKEYLLSIIYVSETTKQASPATYEIQQDGSQYFIAPAFKRLYVDYDPAKDILRISSLGDYLRN